MNERKYNFENLKKDINLLSPKEKIKLIKQKLDIYSEWSYKDGKNLTAAIFAYNFKEDAEALLIKLEQENPHSYSKDLNWYYNADNIPNQNAVFATDGFLHSYRKDAFEPLAFFNLLFRQIDELKDNLDTPIDYINHLKKLPFSKEQLHLLFGMIIYWHGGTKNVNPKYKTPLTLLEREFLLLYPDEHTPEKKFLNYKDAKTEKPENINKDVATPSKEVNTANEPEPIEENNTEYTTARQVLAMHFILEHLQVKSNEIDRKVKAEFVQFFTGKNYKNVYDALQNPFVTKQKKFRFEDLQYIRPFFENLGLSEIVKVINNQLDKPR